MNASHDRFGNNLVCEYRAALLATRADDLAPLLAAGVSRETLISLGVASGTIRVAGTTYEPAPDGDTAYIVPVRIDQPVSPETANTSATLTRGGIADLLAFHPVFPLRWALRRDAAEWIGAIEPQHLDPPPVPVWRTPLAWMQAGCTGLVVLSSDPADAYRALTACVGGIIAEDQSHAAELRAILAHPWPVPRVILRGQSRAA